MKNQKAMRALTLSVMASLFVSASPVYAEVSRSEAVTAKGKTVAVDAAKDNGGIIDATNVTTVAEAEKTKAGVAKATEKAKADIIKAEQGKTAADYMPPEYKEERRNGVTYISQSDEKDRKKAGEQAYERAKEDAAKAERAAERAKPKPGKSVMNQTTMDESSIQSAESKYTGLQKKVAPYVGSLVTKVDLAGKMTKDKNKIMEVLKMRAGSKLTASGFEDDLKSLYETGWFYEITPSFNSVPEGTQIIYTVSENPVFTKLDVEGNTKLSTDKIISIMNLKPNEVLNTKEVNQGARKIESEYSQQGYILAKVSDVRLLPDGHLAMQISEGVVEGFKVKGNTKTKDYVITREMKLKKGEPFNAKAARRSMQKIYNLGYFEDVNIKLNPGEEPNTVSVEISVVEASTGSFGIGAGYSDSDGFIGMISVGDKNFRGTGDKVNVRWEFGGDSETNANFEVSYVKPWIDKKETTAALTVYRMTNQYIDYDRNADEIARYYKRRTGAELTFSRVTDNEFITNSIRLKNRDDKYVRRVSGYNTNQYYEALKDGFYLGPDKEADRMSKNFGLTRSITLARTLDTRDNIYDPREGKRTNYSVEVSSFGGDFNFQKYSTDFRYYYKSGKENTWAFNWSAGYANGDMPLSQRFAVGGSETLRGYKDDQYKGNSMLRASLEFRHPLMKKVEGVIFTDTGYAWSKDYDETNFHLGNMLYSTGIGLRINSPLGPLRLDYGFPLKDGHGGRFHFSFGGQF